MKETKGKYFNNCVKEYDEGGVAKMGYMSSYAYFHQPIRLALTSARYKFVSKMFAGMGKVLELGCADAFYSAIVAENVKKLVATDYDPVFIDQAKELGRPENIELKVLDLAKEPCKNEFDGVYALDVFEHIDPKDEDVFMRNVIRALKDPSEGGGVLILGIPSLESQVYASEGSKAEHVNCKSGEDFKQFCKKYFHQVFVFSMNDEVVHTGFYPMAHYLFAVCVGQKY